MPGLSGTRLASVHADLGGEWAAGACDMNAATTDVILGTGDARIGVVFRAGHGPASVGEAYAAKREALTLLGEETLPYIARGSGSVSLAAGSAVGTAQVDGGRTLVLAGADLEPEGVLEGSFWALRDGSGVFGVVSDRLEGFSVVHVDRSRVAGGEHLTCVVPLFPREGRDGHCEPTSCSASGDGRQVVVRASATLALISEGVAESPGETKRPLLRASYADIGAGAEWTGGVFMDLAGTQVATLAITPHGTAEILVFGVRAQPAGGGGLDSTPQLELDSAFDTGVATEGGTLTAATRDLSILAVRHDAGVATFFRGTDGYVAANAGKSGGVAAASEAGGVVVIDRDRAAPAAAPGDPPPLAAYLLRRKDLCPWLPVYVSEFSTATAAFPDVYPSLQDMQTFGASSACASPLVHPEWALCGRGSGSRYSVSIRPRAMKRVHVEVMALGADVHFRARAVVPPRSALAIFFGDGLARVGSATNYQLVASEQEFSALVLPGDRPSRVTLLMTTWADEGACFELDEIIDSLTRPAAAIPAGADQLEAAQAPLERAVGPGGDDGVRWTWEGAEAQEVCLVGGSLLVDADGTHAGRREGSHVRVLAEPVEGGAAWSLELCPGPGDAPLGTLSLTSGVEGLAGGALEAVLDAVLSYEGW